MGYAMISVSGNTGGGIPPTIGIILLVGVSLIVVIVVVVRAMRR